MLLLCAGLFGSYYVFDIPAATEGAMQTEIGSSTASICINGTAPANDNPALDTFNNDFNLLYSVYSWPNVLLPFFGGFLADKLGVRYMGVLFMGLITIGQAIVAIGSTYLASDAKAAWYTMWIGRTIFGFGGESLSVVQSAFIAQYFQGKELAFALGISLALARVGSVINNVLSAVIAQNASVSLAYWVGLGVCGFAMFCTVWVFYLDITAENILRKSKGLAALKNSGMIATTRKVFCSRCNRRGGGGFAPIDEDADEEAGPKEEIHMAAALRFPLIFWVLTLSCLTIYIDVLTFNNNCADFVTQKYLAPVGQAVWQMCDDAKSGLYLKANSIMSITYLVAGFMTPLFGSMCDYLGFRAVFNVAAAAAITGVHAVLSYTDFQPVVPLVALGLCYSIYASALWPSIAIVIEPKNQATAYGLVTAVQNFGLAVSPLVVATLMPSAQCAAADCIAGWNRTETFFMYLGVAGVGCGIALNIVDGCWSKHPALNLSNAGLAKLVQADAEEPVKAGLLDYLRDVESEERIHPFAIAPPSPAPNTSSR
jgi:MFS family permease